MKPKKEYKTPAGTVVLMVIFILLIIALWGQRLFDHVVTGSDVKEPKYAH